MPRHVLAPNLAPRGISRVGAASLDVQITRRRRTYASRELLPTSGDRRSVILISHKTMPADYYSGRTLPLAELAMAKLEKGLAGRFSEQMQQMSANGKAAAVQK